MNPLRRPTRVIQRDAGSVEIAVPRNMAAIGAVAYCRGAYCVLSFEAVAALRATGYNIRRLEDGLPEWKASGFATGTAA